MRVKYQITMEVEVEVEPKTELSAAAAEELGNYARTGFKGRAYTRDKAVVNKVEVSRIGATGVTPKVVKKATFTPSKTRTYYPHRRRG